MSDFKGLQEQFEKLLWMYQKFNIATMLRGSRITWSWMQNRELTQQLDLLFGELLGKDLTAPEGSGDHESPRLNLQLGLLKTEGMLLDTPNLIFIGLTTMFDPLSWLILCKHFFLTPKNSRREKFNLVCFHLQDDRQHRFLKLE